MAKKNERALDAEPGNLTPSESDVDVSHGVTDAVFGHLDEEGPNYRNVGWIGILGLMLKTQVGLGVLSIPAVFDTLGLIPGILAILAVGGMITWSMYMIGKFKLRHREVYSIDDAGYLMFGTIGREILGITSCIYLIFVSGSSILSLSIGLNAVSTHGACTAIFVGVAAIVAFMFSSIRTLGKLTWLAWIGVASILAGIMTLTIAVGVQDRPSDAPQEGPWASDYKLFKTPSFTTAISAVSSLVFSYGGTPSFFQLIAEMRDPRDYTRSLLICQSLVTIMYITIGCVVYYFCGSYVATPALGSAGVVLKKIAYGLSLPGLAVTTILIPHYPAKYIFVRLMRNSKHLTSNTLTHWATWISCTLGVTLVAYLIASGIPSFGPLVSLIGALLGALMNLQPMGCMWLYDNWSSGKARRSTKWMLGVCWSIFIIAAGTLLMVAGTYGAIVAIIDAYKALGGSSAAWSCADNSNSV